MSTLENTHDASNDVTADFEQKAAAIAAALADAPHGRHKEEREALEAVRERFAGRAAESDRDTVEAFFEQQGKDLERVQRTELDVGKRTLTAADSLEYLKGAVEAIGGMHSAEHERLAAERSELDKALATDDAAGRRELLEGLRQRQADAAALDAAFVDASADTGAEATNPQRHRRGNFGERAATEALAAEGFSILDYKPNIEDTTKRGIDIVAMQDDTVYLIDNKALSRDGDVYAVSALTTNFERNLAETLRNLEAMASDSNRSADERDLIDRAISALEQGDYVRAVTNANVTHDAEVLEDVSLKLAQQQIAFLDVMRRQP